MDPIAQTLEDIYTAIRNENAGLDEAIDALKKALAAKGDKSVLMDKERLAYNNRQGRKLLQSYFKKRGVVVEFAA